MTVPKPPRAMQRILESVDADPEFADAVLGDLAEEFELRCELDGVPTARRWYRREAVRTLPHLLRDNVRRLGAADFADVARAVISAYAITAAIGGITLAAVVSFFARLGVHVDARPLPWDSPLFRFAALPVLALTATGYGVLGGYLAARLGRRSPLLCAVAFGVAWASLGGAAAMITSAMYGVKSGVTAWVPLQLALIIVLPTIGGVLRVSTAPGAGPKPEGST